jgi:hypothetical protein
MKFTSIFFTASGSIFYLMQKQTKYLTQIYKISRIDTNFYLLDFCKWFSPRIIFV